MPRINSFNGFNKLTEVWLGGTYPVDFYYDFGSEVRDAFIEITDEWTIKNGTYKEHNVLDSRHELYAECKTVIQSVLSSRRLDLSPRLLQLLELKKL